MSTQTRDLLRERADQRFFALDTLRTAIEWINQTNPQVVFKAQDKGAPTLGDDEMKQRWREWLNTSGDLITKANELPTIMVEDAIKIMKQVTGDNAQQKTTP